VERTQVDGKMIGDLKSPEEKSPSTPGGGGRSAGHVIAIAVAGIIIAVIAGGVLLNNAVKEPGLVSTCAVPGNDDIVYQVSTIDALMSSLYDGVETTGDLERHGNFGSGTFEGLDGELIAIDGDYYQAKSDGTVSITGPSLEVPFATVKFFKPDNSFMVNGGGNISEFEHSLDMLLPSRNYIYAIRIDGTFPEMTVRAIPKQEKPYPILSAAAEQQSVLHLKNTTGTIVGFYFPPSFRNINIPGYHFHYISADRTRGGHILDVVIPDIPLNVVVDQSSDVLVELPGSDTFMHTDLSKDLSGDINSIEKITG
jgi:acetolactate decarboxylase